MFRRQAVACIAITGSILALVDMRISAGQEKAAESKNTVSLVIDYGDGVEKHFTRMPWTKGLTVLAALRSAEKHPHGIKLQVRGQGETAFVTKIDDLENEGAERNWIYRVNGKVAKESCGVCQLADGDVVLWSFK